MKACGYCNLLIVYHRRSTVPPRGIKFDIHDIDIGVVLSMCQALVQALIVKSIMQTGCSNVDD